MITLSECYEKMEGNYLDVKTRLRSDRLIDKFLKKFLDDPSFSQFMQAIDEKNAKDAFMALHTLKGICQNLGMGALYESANELCELFRLGWSDEGASKSTTLGVVYEQTINAIKEHFL
ncbi:hypothetical protein C815_00849 [Firmicutes bacterium M10-2]|nr:hypothetical protein C815_00849 [Firmicutes bacterium M10-2]